MHIKRNVEKEGILVRKSVFYIDETPAYVGYTNGDLWNGWATPYFTLEEAQKIQAEWNKGVEFPMLYDVSKDEFCVKYDGDDEPYIWKGEDIKTVDGIKHLYGIGAYSHIWDELDDYGKQYLAQNICELICEYHQEWYENHFECGDDLMDYIIEDVLVDIDVLAQAYTIVNDESLDDKSRIDKLAEVLAL